MVPFCNCLISVTERPNENITYCVALNQNGEVLDEKIFNFNFARKNKIIPLTQSQDQEKKVILD